MSDDYILCNILNMEHHEGSDLVKMWDGYSTEADGTPVDTIVSPKVWQPMVDNVREALLYEINQQNTVFIKSMNEINSVVDRHGYYGNRVKEITNEV